MSTDIIICDGDGWTILPNFGPRIVTLLGPATIKGNGSAKINGKRICIAGDEKKQPSTQKASYVAGAYVGGMGTVTISQLAANQQANACCDGHKLILKGTLFTATFQVSQPAVNPAGTPDPQAGKPERGKGSFVPKQQTVTAQ